MLRGGIPPGPFHWAKGNPTHLVAAHATVERGQYNFNGSHMRKEKIQTRDVKRLPCAR
jgi:hypothetical protein